MPSSQMQTSTNMNGQSGTIISKAPPPNKLPPPPPPPPPQPPPPPPRPARLDPNRLPPPPPPRNSSQSTNQANIPINPLCASNNLNISTGSASNILNNGSSINSLNSAGRCSYTQSLGGGAPNTINHNHRSFVSKHGDTCSSRSSVSSHSSSLLHHHHNLNNNNSNNINNNNNLTIGLNNNCNHQSNLGYACSNLNGIQHNHVNSSSLSDCGSCNYSQDNRNFAQIPCGGCCTPSNNSHHVHNVTMSKCQVPNISSSSNGVRIFNNGSSTTTISRNALLYNPENIELDPTSNGCNGEQFNRGHCQSIYPHHHHHHHHPNLHNVQMSSSSSLSSLQPIDPNTSSSSFHRCNMSQSNIAPTASGIVDDQIERPSVINHCNHLHSSRVNVGGHHHLSNYCEHHIQTTTAVQQQVSNGCVNCLHTHNTPTHHDCNPTSLIGKNCSLSNPQHRCPSELLPVNQSSDASNNDSLVSTAHTHNLSNSSTTTHTSNVAVKHQPQFHRPVLSRGGRSNSSQQYEYGPSSAASTSSATASLSSYQNPSGYDDRIPLYPSSKIHQPLPPPPISSKSRPHTPQMLISGAHDSGNLQIVSNNLTNTSNQLFQQQPNINQTFPPLPPKPTSPNASSNSTQITTLRTSPSLQNQPITRVTSQAGVQNPLPDSDVPPPLPPLNPGSRTQPHVNTLMTRMPNISDVPLNPIPSFVNLNLNRTNSSATSAERKTEALTRQIEFELEQQQKSGEPHGICPKCGTKVMPAQDACKAMDQIYHAACFVCCECNRTLRGKTFYPVGDKVYCEEDFNVSFR